MLVTQGTIANLHVGFSTVFKGSLKSASNDWREVARRVPSSTRRNEYAWLRNIPRIRRTLGDKIFESLIRKAYTIENYKFHSGVEVDVDDIEDDNIGSYNLAFEMHAKEASHWLDQAVYTLLPRGLTSAGLCYDDEPFFSQAHSKLKSGETYSNLAPGAEAPWYLLETQGGVQPFILQERKPLRLSIQNQPTDNKVFEDDEVRWLIKGRYGFGYTFPQFAYASQLALNEENLESAFVAMMQQTGDDGRKLNIKPRLLVVGPSNYFAAERLIKALQVEGGGTNIHAGSLKVVSSQFVEEVAIQLD